MTASQLSKALAIAARVATVKRHGSHCLDDWCMAGTNLNYNNILTRLPAAEALNHARLLTSRKLSSCSEAVKEKTASGLGLVINQDGSILNQEDDDEMEEMWVDPDPILNLSDRMKEHGGPRRGGRFMEPTRFGDWERKSRCSDF